MSHRVIGGKILIEEEQPEGEEEGFEVHLTYKPAHGTTPEELGQRVKQLRRKLDKFYGRLVEDYED